LISNWPLDWPLQDLGSAGLNVACCVRLKLFTLDERLILGALGKLTASDRNGVWANLHQLFPQEEHQP
jgi:mRNA interferase MazF